MNNELRQELLRLLARESYFERELTLASGRASNYYIDCKRTLYWPRGAHLAGELLIELVAAEGIELDRRNGGGRDSGDRRTYPCGVPARL